MVRSWQSLAGLDGMERKFTKLMGTQRAKDERTFPTIITSTFPSTNTILPLHQYDVNNFDTYVNLHLLAHGMAKKN